MFKKLFLLAIFVITTNCSPSYKGNDSVEHLGQTIFNAFVNDNFDEFKKYIITFDDRVALLDSTNFSEVKKNAYLRKYDEETPELAKTIEGYFASVKNQAKEKNIVFKKVEFEKVEYRLSKYTNNTYALVNIVFNYNNVKYFIRLLDCINTNRGWVMSGDVYLEIYPVE